MTITKRICIYPKDVMNITGKSERYSRKILEKIRIELQKADHQFITVEEFCEYYGLKLDQVQALLI